MVHWTSRFPSKLIENQQSHQDHMSANFGQSNQNQASFILKKRQLDGSASILSTSNHQNYSSNLHATVPEGGEIKVSPSSPLILKRPKFSGPGTNLSENGLINVCSSQKQMPEPI